jgi:hypothetical protein
MTPQKIAALTAANWSMKATSLPRQRFGKWSALLKLIQPGVNGSGR